MVDNKQYFVYFNVRMLFCIGGHMKLKIMDIPDTKIFFILFFSINLIPFYYTCRSQTSPDKIDSALTQADKYYNEGNYKEAERNYDSIVIMNENCIPAITGLAKSEYSQNNFLNARSLIEKAIKIDSTNIELRYYYAIMVRDIARYGNSINSINIEFKDEAFKISEDNFKWVIKKDPLFREVYYQYSLLLRFRGKYLEALKSNIEQIKLKPLESGSYCGLRRNLTAAYKNIKYKIIEEYLNEERSDLKTYLLGELKRMDGDPESAKAILNRLLDSNVRIPKALVYISLFKCMAEKTESGQFEEFYWETLDKIKNKTGFGILFDDVKYLSLKEEIEEIQNLSEREENISFFNRFWNKRNPTPLAKFNPRISEHYKRLLYAEKNYNYDRERYSFVRYPDSYLLNHEFTDQGFIYIRHGNPDDKMQTSYSKLSEAPGGTNRDALRFKEENTGQNKDEYALMESMITNNKVVKSGGTGYPVCESWLYHAEGETPKMIFYFLGGEKNLTPIVFERHVLENIRSWDKNIADYLFDTDEIRIGGNDDHNPTPIGKIKAEMRQTFGDDIDRLTSHIFNEGKNNIKKGLSEERSSWNKDKMNFDLNNSIYTFRGLNDKTTLELVFLIPTSDIFKKIPDSVNSLKIETGYGIYDKNWNSSFVKTDTLSVKRPSKDPDAYLKKLQCEIDPDTCGISFFYHPLGTEIYGNFKKPYRVINYQTSGLKISDIILASKIEKSTGFDIFNKKDLKVIPYILKKQPLKRPLNIYFEIYNLKKNLDGKTVFSIEYSMKYLTDDKNIINTVFGTEKTNSISTEYNKFGKDEMSQEYISIDINKLIPGKYILSVTVKDINGRKTEKRSSEIELF
jgi:GWxTD domain-containing protein